MIHMPKGSKVLKDILSHKEKLEMAVFFVKLSKECSAVIQRSLPQKEGDTGSFTLPFLIEPLVVKNALANLGASINLMPHSLFRRLGISELKPTRMSIQLADRSIKYPIRVCENLLVKENKFIFLVDFVVLEIDKDELVSIILRWPFLATAQAIIDVHEGKLSLRVRNETVTFNIGKSMKSKYSHDDYLHYTDLTMKLVREQWVDTIDHDGKRVEAEEEGGLNKVQAVSFYLKPEPVEPLEWKDPENRLKPSSIEPPKLELKELPEHLEYAFIQENNQLLVVISSALSATEKTWLREVLRNHKGAIAWSIMDIKGIDSSFCTHKILMEDEFKPSVVPKKGGMTVVKNEKNELIPQRTVTRWRVCIDYRKLYNATRKDHFSLPFIDQMLERLAGHEYYCFLDGFSGYFQIPIALEDQEKTTFTCPYGTFAYIQMPFGLCNAPATFQCCMTAIFHELIEDSMEVFMDDFSIFGSSFDHYLKNLEKMLKRCEETNLVLNWEKCPFMVKEGIVLGQKVFGSRIEVDKAKIKSISKLPYTTNVKAIRSFLGNAGFYRRFIKDFSQVTHPMTQLLMKDAPFNFSKECKQAFDKLKQELTQPPIMIKMDWSLPFEIMCDASDYAVRAVLGQRKDKHFQSIHYASKTMNEAQENYTTAEKELLAVILAFDKFRQYLVLSKTIVFTYHSALRYLFTKQDAKPRLIRDLFLEEQLMTMSNKGNEPWYAHYANYLAIRVLPFCSTRQEKQKFFNDLWHYFWDESFLLKQCADQIIRRCVARNEAAQILQQCHSGPSGGHHDDALWAFRTTFKTPLGTTRFRRIYGKACHLPVELEHKPYWAIKACNMDLIKARANTFLKINELDKLRLDAYESSISYKEGTKRWHDKRIKTSTKYEKGDKVLLFNSCLRLFSGKLKSRWYGPFAVSKHMKNGAIELYDEDGNEFIVNKQCVKPYQKDTLIVDKDDDITLADEGEVT
ncbi:putative nucleotidyltransferase, ribonuclease H [Tanacetum coccineum]